MEHDDLPWSPSPDAPFLVADWTVDAPANRLLRGGDEVRLEPKVMSVLVYLARHRGRVVSRDDLESGVWTGMVVCYDELLQGNDHYGRRSFQDNELAKGHYRRAIELDPGFARAYAALALAYSRDAVDGWEPSARGAMERAAALVEQAAKLDPKVPQIYFVRSQITLYRRDYAEAVRQAEQAIALSPGYADAYALLAWVLHFAGRPAEGLDEMERAVRLNPTLPSIYRLVRGALHYSLGDYPSAIADLEPAIPMNPTYQMLRLWLAAAYAGSGRIEEAQWEAAELMALNPGFTLEYVKTVYPIRDPKYQERLIGDLRKAGIE